MFLDLINIYLIIFYLFKKEPYELIKINLLRVYKDFNIIFFLFFIYFIKF